MFKTIVIVGCILITSIFIYYALKELLCIYRNSLLLFNDKGKKFNEIKIKKMRSILEDNEVKPQ